jgi:hypothetical protein
MHHDPRCSRTLLTGHTCYSLCRAGNVKNCSNISTSNGRNLRYWQWCHLAFRPEKIWSHHTLSIQKFWRTLFVYTLTSHQRSNQECFTVFCPSPTPQLIISYFRFPCVFQARSGAYPVACLMYIGVTCRV